MSRNHNDDPKNIWDRIKNTDTFQSLKANTEKIKKSAAKNNDSNLSIAGREKES